MGWWEQIFVPVLQPDLVWQCNFNEQNTDIIIDLIEKSQWCANLCVLKLLWASVHFCSVTFPVTQENWTALHEKTEIIILNNKITVMPVTRINALWKVRKQKIIVYMSIDIVRQSFFFSFWFMFLCCLKWFDLGNVKLSSVLCCPEQTIHSVLNSSPKDFHISCCTANVNICPSYKLLWKKLQMTFLLTCSCLGLCKSSAYTIFIIAHL